jgi:hypothetical protein
MKLRLSSSGCETRPAKLSPPEPVASLATVAATRPAKRMTCSRNRGPRGAGRWQGSRSPAGAPAETCSAIDEVHIVASGSLVRKSLPRIGYSSRASCGTAPGARNAASATGGHFVEVRGREPTRSLERAPRPRQQLAPEVDSGVMVDRLVPHSTKLRTKGGAVPSRKAPEASVAGAAAPVGRSYRGPARPRLRTQGRVSPSPNRPSHAVPAAVRLILCAYRLIA